MGDNKNKTTQTTGSMPQESSQVGTHGQTGSKEGGKGQGKDWSQGEGSQSKSQDQGDWNDRAQRDMAQGDETKPAQPDGTSPLDKDQQPVNQNRGQQNR